MEILKSLVKKIKEILHVRLIFMTILAIILFSVLIVRMYRLQILEKDDSGQVVTDSLKLPSLQTRYTDSTRGNIYDRNGNLLAYNVQTFSVVMSNSSALTNNNVKNEKILKLINMLEKHGNTIEVEFPIVLNEDGELEFTVSGNAELRFKKNAFALTSVSKLSEEQRNATAEEVYEFLRKGNKSSSMFGISDEYSVEDTLKIMNIRYALFILYPQYSQFTLCSNIDEKTIAAVKEYSAEIPGIEVISKMSRVYNDSVFFSHILGYTGAASEDEAEAMNEGLEHSVYSTSDQVGKTGIEKEMDAVLRGKKGEVQLTLSSSGKVASQRVVKESESGDDIYLTIDRELQISCYHILENNIAAILISKIVNSDDYGGKGTSASKITIPIYEVYNAFFANGMLDISHFSKDDATALEKQVYSVYLNKYQNVESNLRKILDFDSPVVNKDLSEESKTYIDFIYSMLRSDGLIIRDNIKDNDSVFTRYTDDKISLSEFLQYGINNNWINFDLIGVDSSYSTNREIYDRITAYIFDKLKDNLDYEKLLYKKLIFNGSISGRASCMLLYDQNVLEYNGSDYNKLSSGSLSAYSFVINKLKTLEITPGMLALEPCSGSVVITDPRSGDVLAMVSYPGYDINKMANKIDYNYYKKLISNSCSPMLNRCTQQMTATGSTFKPLMSLAGLGENIITINTQIQDKGIFEEVEPSPKCWKYPGNHGYINLTQAIQHSCNYFFYKVGYEMSLDANGEYSDSLGISKIQKYAALFGLSAKSGVEVPETLPSISDTDAVRTSIGYYHNFSPIQIARYLTAIANKGTVYNLTLIDKTENKDKNLVVNNSATVYNKIDIYSDAEWSAVQKGMYDVVNTSANSLNKLYGDLGPGIMVAGKTGTAQVSLTHPSHALFISFAPYSSPSVCVAVVLPNGYASANAAKLAREVYGLYFNEENKEDLLSGDLTTTNVTSISVSD